MTEQTEDSKGTEETESGDSGRDDLVEFVQVNTNFQGKTVATRHYKILKDKKA